EDGIRDRNVTGVQTCALPILGFLQRGEYLDSRLPTLFIHCREPKTLKCAGICQTRRLVWTPQSRYCVLQYSRSAQNRCGSIQTKIGRASCRERVESEVESGV